MGSARRRFGENPTVPKPSPPPCSVPPSIRSVLCTISVRKMKKYQAIVWSDDHKIPGKRVAISASDLKEARVKLEEIYGKGNIFDLHDSDDSNKPR
jgi:hypothetical protein